MIRRQSNDTHVAFREYIYEPGFENGLLMYRIPDELTEKLSVISVSPDEVEFPVDISRYLLVAMPFRGEQ